MSPFRIVNLDLRLGGTYGDRGNSVVLVERLRRRGIAVELATWEADDGDVPSGADLYVLGGAEDSAQLRLVNALRSGGFAEAVSGGAHVFAVCAGLQLLGHSFGAGGQSEVPGLGLLDATSTRLAERVVGEVVTSPVAGGQALTGFANHQGGTALGSAAQPLGTTTLGRGNRGLPPGDAEGAVQERIVATYLHGPVLARNPALADWLLERATGQELAPLPTGPAEALHQSLLAPHRTRRPRRWRWSAGGS